MGISLSFNVAELTKAIGQIAAEAIADGGLDGKETWYEYLTQEDDRVRPSHAALHGTRWRADDPDAPTPPLDYGCRCFIRYIAAPNSNAAEILPEAAGPLSNRADAYSKYLNEHVSEWEKIAGEAKKIAPANRYQFILAELQDVGYTLTDSREYAAMILGTL